MARHEVVLWQRGSTTHTHTTLRKDEMSTTTTTSDAARQAIGAAADLLRPHGNDDPELAAVVATLDTIAPGESADEDERDEQIVKSLEGIHHARVRLSKSDNSSPSLADDLARADRTLQLAYLRKNSSAYRDDGEEDRLTKALTDLTVTRDQLRKSESAGSGTLRRVEKAHRELQREYLAQHSGNTSWERSAAETGWVA